MYTKNIVDNRSASPTHLSQLKKTPINYLSTTMAAPRCHRRGHPPPSPRHHIVTATLWVGRCSTWPLVHFARGQAVSSAHRLVLFVAAWMPRGGGSVLSDPDSQRTGRLARVRRRFLDHNGASPPLPPGQPATGCGSGCRPRPPGGFFGRW